MRKRIYISFCLLGIAVTLLATVLTTFSFYRFFSNRVEEELRTDALVLSSHLENTAETPQAYLSSLAGKLNDDLRITLIAPNGTVLYDSASNPVTMENHSNRPEFIDAMNSGEGQSVRKSETQGQDAFYHALLLESGGVLRVSRLVDNVTTLFLNLLPIVFGILLVLLVLSVAVSSVLTKMLIRPFDRAVASLDRPRARPAVIVAPERETPGMMAAACARPMTAARVQLSVSNGSSRRTSRSTRYSTMPMTISATATTSGLRKTVAAFSSSSAPKMAPGTEVTTRKPARRLENASPRTAPTASARQSAHSAARTATALPRCSMMSNWRLASTGSVRRNIHGVSVRCADELMGRNSARP
jgi:hypothetical protein